MYKRQIQFKTTPPCLDNALSSLQAEDSKKEWEGLEEKKEGRFEKCANLAKSLSMPYGLENIGSGRQSSHEAHYGQGQIYH